MSNELCKNKYMYLKKTFVAFSQYMSFTKRNFLSNFCGLLRKPELYIREMFPIELQCTCRRTAITRSENSHAIEKERKAKKAVSRFCSLITLGGLSKKAIFYL